MGFFSMFNRVKAPQQTEKRGIDYTNLWLTAADFFGGVSSESGIAVTEGQAIREASVMACVKVLSEVVAQLPLQVYRRVGETREIARDFHLYNLLHTKPNKYQTSFSWRELGMTQMLLSGDSFFAKAANSRGVVSELLPLDPSKVQPFSYTKDRKKSTTEILPGSKIAYQITLNDGTREVLLRDEVLHIHGMSFNGLRGMNPIQHSAETIGLSIAGRTFGSKLFSNGARPQGTLEIPEVLDDKAYYRLKDSWDATFRGTKNAHGTALLEGGTKYHAISMTSKDAQYLELRKYQRSEIAAIFRVPLHLINDLERATFSNIEHLGSEFVTYSLMPWLRRWESNINQDVFTEAERKQGYFAEFDVNGLLRGDAAARAAYYQSGIQNGWLVRNEARAKENLNPIDGLGTPLQPLNMVEAGQVPNVGTPDKTDDVQPRGLSPVAKAAIDRVLRKEEKSGKIEPSFVVDVLAVDKKSADEYVLKMNSELPNIRRIYLEKMVEL